MLTQPKINSNYCLTPVCKTLGVTSYESQFVWKEDHFCSSVVEVLSCYGCLITCMGAHFPTVELDNPIRFRIFPGCLGSCGIVPDGPTGLVVSFNIGQRLKCKHIASTPTLIMWLLCSNRTLPWTTKFLGVFLKTDTT